MNFCSAKIQERKAAAEEESDPAAMYMFGEMYEKGKGVSKNEKKAVEWFVEAYEEGYEAGYHAAIEEMEDALDDMRE